MDWQPIETVPKDRNVRVFAPSLYHEEHNPNATADAFWDELADFNDDNANVPGLVGAVWTTDSDDFGFMTVLIRDAEAWQELPDPPRRIRNVDQERES